MKKTIVGSSARAMLIGVIGVTMLATGCVQRRMLIRSYPEGALVHVDQQEVGYTPVSVPFTYYGAHRILVEKDGFETVEVDERIDAPWYQIPPLDFIAENFWPREIRDERIIEFQLQPQQLAREGEVLERAQQMRQNVSQGIVVPLLEENDGTRAFVPQARSPQPLLGGTP